MKSARGLFVVVALKLDWRRIDDNVKAQISSQSFSDCTRSQAKMHKCDARDEIARVRSRLSSKIHCTHSRRSWREIVKDSSQTFSRQQSKLFLALASLNTNRQGEKVSARMKEFPEWAETSSILVFETTLNCKVATDFLLSQSGARNVNRKSLELTWLTAGGAS